MSMPEQEKKILFVRSGGGLPGLDLHAGMWLALYDSGIEATACCGTSAGAIVAALDASGRQPHWFTAFLRSKKDRHVLARRLFWKLRAFHINHFIKTKKIEKLMRGLCPATFAELSKPCMVWATNDEEGTGVALNTGNLYRAVQASIAIAGVFPPVQMPAGFMASDGGTTAYLPLPDDWEEYDEVYLLIARRPLDYHKRSRTIISRLLYGVDLLGEDQINEELRKVSGYLATSADMRKPIVYVIRPDLPVPLGILHFDHRLISRAYHETKRQLNEQQRAVGRENSESLRRD